MNIEEFVKYYSEEDELKIMFAWNGKHSEEFLDENMPFRLELLKYFESRPDECSIELVAALYCAETEYAKEAWGVNRIVSLLAEQLLERGRSKYASEYLKGWGRGMDAHIQSKQVQLSMECIQELISFAKSRKEKDEFPNSSQAQYFKEFLESKLESKH